MTYRVELSSRVLGQLGGLPEAASAQLESGAGDVGGGGAAVVTVGYLVVVAPQHSTGAGRCGRAGRTRSRRRPVPAPGAAPGNARPGRSRSAPGGRSDLDPRAERRAQRRAGPQHGGPRGGGAQVQRAGVQRRRAGPQPLRGRAAVVTGPGE